MTTKRKQGPLLHRSNSLPSGITLGFLSLLLPERSTQRRPRLPSDRQRQFLLRQNRSRSFQQGMRASAQTVPPASLPPTPVAPVRTKPGSRLRVRSSARGKLSRAGCPISNCTTNGDWRCGTYGGKCCADKGNLVSLGDGRPETKLGVAAASGAASGQSGASSSDGQETATSICLHSYCCCTYVHSFRERDCVSRSALACGIPLGVLSRRYAGLRSFSSAQTCPGQKR